MNTESQLQQKLNEIDHKSYPAYKSLKGSWKFRNFILTFDHIQGDPFASPSDVSIHIPFERAGFPEAFCKAYHTRTAMEDLILRTFSRELERISNKAGGSGKSGLITTTRPGQIIAERTAMSLRGGELAARFRMGLPARGRTIDARSLNKMVFDLLPGVVEKTLFYKSYNPNQVKAVYELAEDQQYIREKLGEMGLSAFIADGSVLPRESGVSDRPMKNAVPFFSPESLKVNLTLPHHGQIEGMGIPNGVTLIIGGGFHGKSTLLKSVEQGVYNHIKGDGREFVITENSAMKLRAEDGRAVTDLDISLFIHDLPGGRKTDAFSTKDASGSTSQAAAVIECLEAGAKTMLIDEDTSATNFLVRDEFMQKIVSAEKEPITPFVTRVRQIYERLGVSTVLVAGSSGSFFHVADTIIQMDEYRPVDVKEKVLPLLNNYAAPECMNDALSELSHGRRFWAGGVKRDKNDRLKVRVNGKDGFSVDRNQVDLRLVEQICDTEQVAALAEIMRYILLQGMGKLPVCEIVDKIDAMIREGGLESIQGSRGCGLTRPRREEIQAMLNRYRG